MTQAINYHNQEAQTFKEKYYSKKSFRSRLELWRKLIKSGDRKIINSMDLGCGPGWMTKILCEVSEKVVAVDGSEQMIKLCQTTVAEDVPKVEFVNAAITTAILDSLSSRKFDLIISSSVLEYVEGAEGILNKCIELLSNGGTLAFSMPNRSSWFRKIEWKLYVWFGRPKYRELIVNAWSYEYATTLLSKIGFKIEQAYFQGYVPIYSEFFFWLPERFRKPMIIFVCKKQ